MNEGRIKPKTLKKNTGDKNKEISQTKEKYLPYAHRILRTELFAL